MWALECLKVKLPRYRHTVAPTHFQKQVGRGIWLLVWWMFLPPTHDLAPEPMISLYLAIQSKRLPDPFEKTLDVRL